MWPNCRQKILRRSQDRDKAVDNGLRVGKVVQFLLYGKIASSVSHEYVRHVWMNTGDDFFRTAARGMTALAQIVPDYLA